MKTFIRSLLFTSIFIAMILGFSSCSEEIIPDDLFDFGFGWLQSDENLDELESNINFGSSNVENLPSSVDLLEHFPPVGDQGQYGTCVSWACAYNLKTYLEAVDQGYSKNDLTDPGKQFSPKDLFWAIPNSDKGADCNGTNFEYAFDQMVDRGVATMSKVPYSNLGNCSSTPPADWNQEANQFKLDNYRKVNLDVSTIKSMLAQKRPVVIGAKLGDKFMNWDNAGVISSDAPGYTGQHAYHAMIISGYDDSKGPNGAFRVVNSWDTFWGDKGYIWVDYDFAINDFLFCAFVAKNKPSDGFNPDEDNDNVVDNDELVDGDIDVVAWELSDVDNENETDPTYRSISYNVFNVGTETIPSSKDWDIMYLYYNAYDANEYDILLYDYYTDDFDNEEHNGSLDDGPGISGNWWNNVDIPGGVSVAQALYGSSDSRFYWGYKMPENITGYYYLVLYADGFENLSEFDETNNLIFVTDPDGNPLYVENGVIDIDFFGKKAPKLGVQPNYSPKRGAKSLLPTARNKKNVNTYTPREIKELIKHHKQTGALHKKVQDFKSRNQLVKSKRP